MLHVNLNANITYNNVKLWLSNKKCTCRKICQHFLKWVIISTNNSAADLNKEKLTLLKSTVLFSLLTSVLFSTQAGVDCGETI